MHKRTKNTHLKAGQELDYLFSLKQLLAQVTEENLHGEVDTGYTTGKEAW